MTDTKDAALLEQVAGKVTPPLSEQERARATALMEQGADPVVAAEQVLDERIGTNARSIRERDGDPYPSLESLLDESVQRRRAKAKVDEAFGDDAETLSPDMARLRAALDEARTENERLREENEAKAAQLDAAGNSMEDYERLAQQVADLQRENEELRGSGGGTPQASPPVPGGAEQTGPGSASTKKTTPKDGA